MSTMDLFEDGFPHSTREGYEAGCRGSACLGKLENGFSCSEAAVRYAGDYGYRKRVEAGMTPAEIADADAADRAAAAPAGKAKAKAKPSLKERAERAATAPFPAAERERVIAPKPVPADVTSVVEVAVIDAAAVGGPEEVALGALVDEGLSRAGAAVSAAVDDLVAESVKPKRGRAPGSIEHGTAYGYQRGCRDGLVCPKNADGVSCHEAYRAYQRDYAERRRAAGGVLGSRKGMRRTDRIEVAAEVVEPVPVEADVVLPPSRAVLLPTVDELQSDLAARDARIAELEEQLVAARAAAWSTLIEKAGVNGSTVLRVEVLGAVA